MEDSRFTSIVFYLCKIDYRSEIHDLKSNLHSREPNFANAIRYQTCYLIQRYYVNSDGYEKGV